MTDLAARIAALREQGVELPLPAIIDLVYFAGAGDHLRIKTPGDRGSVTISASRVIADVETLITAMEQAQEAEAALASEQNLTARLRLEAEGWAQEARTQRSTVHECYQEATGATGEPGDWHGAEPVRSRIAELEAALAAEREDSRDGYTVAHMIGFKEGQAAERQKRTYAHMCRLHHEEIGHNESEHERCPLCRALDSLGVEQVLLKQADKRIAELREVAAERRAALDAERGKRCETCGYGAIVTECFVSDDFSCSEWQPCQQDGAAT